MQSFFDFHFHPLFKQYLRSYNPAGRENPTYTQPVRLPGPGRVVDALAGHILESQASVAQSLAGGVRLGVANIVALEAIFASRKGMLKLLELELLGRNVVAQLDEHYFDLFHNGPNGNPTTRYSELFEHQLDFYTWARNQVGEGGRRINLLSRKDAANGSLKLDSDSRVLNLVMAIEGGHNLSTRLVDQTTGEIDPVAQIKRYRGANFEHDFLYLTLTHLSTIFDQPLCSHAYGFKMVKGLPAARPTIAGLRELGKDVIRACVHKDANNPYPILIDVKHSSLLGRRQFFEYRRFLLESPPSNFTPPMRVDQSGGDTGEAWWPIVATHMGVAGFRRRELAERIVEKGIERGPVENRLTVRVRVVREKAAKLPGLLAGSVYFNSASISLFDEDIEEIARSGGLIGISLDARILGFEGLKQRAGNQLFGKYAYDYFSYADFATLFPELAQQLPPMEPVEEDSGEEGGEEEAFHPEEELVGQELFGRTRLKRELFLFCLNVLHTVAVIDQLPADQRQQRSGWDFVCLGSDNDGLIDSIKAARTASDYPDFVEELVRVFPQAEEAYRELHPTPRPLLPYKKRNFDAATFRNQQLAQLCYGNGARFLKDWWGVES